MKLQDNIASEFDEFSKNYTSDMQGCVPHYDSLLAYFAKDYPVDLTVSNILDFGCGNGNVTEQLLKSFPNADYHLLDASNEMLAICKKRCHQNKIHLIASYFQDYQFPKDYYEIIAAGFSMHHCTTEDKTTLFKQCYAALKPGGILAISDLMIHKKDPAHPELINQWGALVNGNFPDGEKWKWIMEHYDEYDKPDGLDQHLHSLKAAGFGDFNIVIKDQYWVHLKAKK